MTLGGSARAISQAARRRGMRYSSPGQTSASSHRISDSSLVDRVEIKPGAPGDLHVALRERYFGPRAAGKERRITSHRPARLDPALAVVEGIAVGQEAEAGGGAYLEQRKRLGKLGEDGEERGATGRLVCLCCPPGHRRRELVGVCADDPKELIRAAWRPVQRTAASRRFGCCLAGGIWARNARTVSSSAIEAATCSYSGERPRASCSANRL
jgi:hypothetical protein